ncbi:ATP-binding protein [Selenomonas sp.]|uniref:ATP-binding protein n=1 Tax=Selenomonas sp. TaxID=2053611 RepID=UPI0025DD7399|nr:ATP-binding protein [Selenomonas sp.]MBQ1867582.1 hypothetical protein [Selenomonas sp.]
MNLFETTTEFKDIPLGFRLQRLEVYNWGTFDGKVWTLDLSGDTSLLTGDVGSGKSTLVDAIITLLVPPRKVTYNKAADASAKERSLASYVRGYYGQKRTEDGGGRPEALRGKDQYSVVLGVFSDRNFGRTVTLAQVFWFPDEAAASPKRFYVLAQKTLSITERFSAIGGDMRAFRKQLERDSFIKTFDDYPQYGHEFRKIFGIRQVQAMDLFQQTISMKKVDSLTGFVRQNMLEVPDAEQEVEVMLRQYHDLEAAHQAVERAREQQKYLQPIETLGQEYAAVGQKQRENTVMQQHLASWFAGKAYKVQAGMLQQSEEKLAGLQKCLQDAKGTFGSLQQQLDGVRREMARNGGQQLDEVRHQLELCQQQKGQCELVREKYQQQLDLLALAMPSSAEAFRTNQQAMQERGQSIEQELEDLMADSVAVEANRKEAVAMEAQLTEEIESLAKRKSNIPNKYVKIRKQLCEDLGLAEDEMPFAGELMAVKETEAEWEGALERLLHGFGISLLVSDAHYGEVAGWMEKHNLHVKLVYFRVSDYVESVDLETLPEDAACRKLLLKEESAYCGWLSGELYTRFRHTCCETMQEFRQAKFALTRNGQVKINGRRHEKDDRRELDNRRDYVLGYSNLRKIQSLQEERENIREEQKFFQQKLRKNKAAQKKLQGEKDAIMLAGQVKSFQELDIVPLNQQLAKLQQRVEELRQKNDVYRKLQEEEQDLVRQVARCQQEVSSKQDEASRIQERCRGTREQMIVEAELMNETPAEVQSEVYPLLERYMAEALPNQTFELTSRPKLQARFGAWLQEEGHRQEQILRHHGEELTRLMTGFRQNWPEASADLLCSPEAAADYIAVLNRLRTDDLPKFEGRFRELLKENTINQIALFQTHLENTCQEIEDRIARINRSLAEIDYNEGRYIQIECSHAVSDTIQQFRRDLRACTDDALTGAVDDSYSEQKFQQVAKILERLQGRPGCTEIDARWRREVIDVRNWYTFAASERWRDPAPGMDVEYEHYTDSGGKSGGQKEKLAYTILAASIVYNFGLEGKRASEQSFRFVVIDEAFLKSSDESARFGLELFRKMDLQLLVVTPLLKIATIEPFVRHVGFVYQKDEEHKSYLRNLTIEQLQAEKLAHASQK